MEVLKLKTTIDTSGHLRLDIPTTVAAGAVDVVVIVNPSGPKGLATPPYDFSDLAGQLSWRGDAVAEQRALRDEW
jgi:histidinol-phosphate/aromatic aminotransferase/cobyric acid decarboxylase-like protein